MAWVSSYFPAPVSDLQTKRQRAPFPQDTVLHETLSAATLFTCASVANLIALGNTFHIHHKDRWAAHYERVCAAPISAPRTNAAPPAPSSPHTGGLLTAWNHTSAGDDPISVCQLIPWQNLASPRKVRYALAAIDMVYANRPLEMLFSHLNVIPVARGAGIFQDAMSMASQRLDCGLWVSMFPEGKLTTDGSLLPMKCGIGKIVSLCEREPVVVPIYARGMEKVKPPRTIVPRFGHHVHIIVGEPVDVSDLRDRYAKMRNNSTPQERRELYQEIADRVGSSLQALSDELDEILAQDDGGPGEA